ncbi:unnamed protein product [Enterobius vermicularis]|uniref:Uncharacterized protein n=1 Tax=Enterobius vermicularis TaxID=51028 RepID=A0A0N4V1S9_ENTVE|nr:unnamed protein product [Enterobius vermicularis]
MKFLLLALFFISTILVVYAETNFENNERLRVKRYYGYGMGGYPFHPFGGYGMHGGFPGYGMGYGMGYGGRFWG